ncbi:hypothetical protein D3C81_842450 [compost metagenome]
MPQVRAQGDGADRLVTEADGRLFRFLRLQFAVAAGQLVVLAIAWLALRIETRGDRLQGWRARVLVAGDAIAALQGIHLRHCRRMEAIADRTADQQGGCRRPLEAGLGRGRTTKVREFIETQGGAQLQLFQHRRDDFAKNALRRTAGAVRLAAGRVAETLVAFQPCRAAAQGALHGIGQDALRKRTWLGGEFLAVDVHAHAQHHRAARQSPQFRRAIQVDGLQARSAAVPVTGVRGRLDGFLCRRGLLARADEGVEQAARRKVIDGNGARIAGNTAFYAAFGEVIGSVIVPARENAARADHHTGKICRIFRGTLAHVEQAVECRAVAGDTRWHQILVMQRRARIDGDRARYGSDTRSLFGA